MTCPNCATLIEFPDGSEVWVDKHIYYFTLLDGRYRIDHHKKLAIKEI